MKLCVLKTVVPLVSKAYEAVQCTHLMPFTFHGLPHSSSYTSILRKLEVEACTMKVGGKLNRLATHTHVRKAQNMVHIQLIYNREASLQRDEHNRHHGKLRTRAVHVHVACVLACM
jgi:hypothetical protein